MKDVIDFQYERITALDKRVRELERYILELCDNNCPEYYKMLVKNEILKQNN